MEVNNKYIRFDWAVKRMLRDKANFAVLEGLVTVLIGEKVTIVELLESEGNQETSTDKFNRVDIKAKNAEGEILIVEVQLTRQLLRQYYTDQPAGLPGNEDTGTLSAWANNSMLGF